MKSGYKLGLVLVFLLAGNAGFSQEGESVSIPEAVRRPMRVESPQYPRDFVIGELGRGDLSQEDLDYATNVLRALMQGRALSPLLQTLSEGMADELIRELQKIRANRFRIGGGKQIVDGAGSFLFRFIGRDGQTGGVMYFVREGNRYTLDDIVLESIPQNYGTGERMSDLFPYERFY
jgi:hypothetical protein